MKFKNSLAATFALFALASMSHASIVTVAVGRAGPIFLGDNGDPVPQGSLIKIGTFIGSPASNSIDDIELVFAEFERYSTSSNGRFGNTVSVHDANHATAFNGAQIYLWAFNSDSVATASEHAIMTNFSPYPSAGDTWRFPMHTGTGTDSIVVAAHTLLTEGNADFTPGAVFSETNGGRITLTPIPEPSSGLLFGLAALTIVLRRGR